MPLRGCPVSGSRVTGAPSARCRAHGQCSARTAAAAGFVCCCERSRPPRVPPLLSELAEASLHLGVSLERDRAKGRREMRMPPRPVWHEHRDPAGLTTPTCPSLHGDRPSIPTSSPVTSPIRPTVSPPLASCSRPPTPCQSTHPPSNPFPHPSPRPLPPPTVHPTRIYPPSQPSSTSLSAHPPSIYHPPIHPSAHPPSILHPSSIRPLPYPSIYTLSCPPPAPFYPSIYPPAPIHRPPRCPSVTVTEALSVSWAEAGTISHFPPLEGPLLLRRSRQHGECPTGRKSARYCRGPEGAVIPCGEAWKSFLGEI